MQLFIHLDHLFSLTVAISTGENLSLQLPTKNINNGLNLQQILKLQHSLGDLILNWASRNLVPRH